MSRGHIPAAGNAAFPGNGAQFPEHQVTARTGSRCGKRRQEIPSERVSKMADQQIWTSGDKVAAAGLTTALFAGLGAVLSRVFTDQMDKENREANR